MKKIRITLYTLVILTIALVSQIVVNNMFRDEGRITDAFFSANSKAEESKLEIVVDYGKRFLSEEDKRNLIDYIAASIELNSDYEIEHQKGKTSSSMVAVKKGKNADTQIEVISVEQNDKAGIREVKQYLIITLMIHKNTSGIMEYKKMLENAVAKLDVVDYQCLIQLNGVYSGDLSIEERNKITDNLLRSLQAKVITDNRENDLYTVYAYTGLVKEYIKVSNQKVNINILMNYDEIKDETTICLASPILNSDY